MSKNERAVLAEFITAHPELRYVEIAQAHHLALSTICRIAQEFHIRRKTGPKLPNVAVEE